MNLYEIVPAIVFKGTLLQNKKNNKVSTQNHVLKN